MSYIGFFTRMTVGLAVLGLVNAITIDNHLITKTSDCYERLAIGERLDPRDVTKSLPLSTVAECQAACSQEDIKCLSFSFGIDPKGNATCELTYMKIEETADLRPIGTISNPDFDLYVKKLGCKLNIPNVAPSPPAFSSNEPPLRPGGPPSSSSDYSGPPTKPDSVPQRPAYNKPSPEILNQHRPVDTHKPSYLVTILDSHPNSKPGYGSDSENPNNSGTRYEVHEQYDYNAHKNKRKPIGRPHYEDVFVFYDPEGSYQNYFGVKRPLPQKPYGGNVDKFEEYPKPLFSYNDEYYYGQPYGSEFDKLPPGYYDRPGFEKPSYNRPNYDRPVYDRPTYDRPTFDKPGNSKPGDRPTYGKPEIDRPDYDKPVYERPINDKPGYGLLDRPVYDNLDRPVHGRPDRPIYDIPDRPVYDISDRPVYDRPDAPFYDRPDRPIYDKPDRPIYDRPGIDKPDRPSYDRPDRPNYNKPDRPTHGKPEIFDYDIPDKPSYNRPATGGYNNPNSPSYDSPDRPSYDRPHRPSYIRPDRPSHDRPDRPNYDRPGSSSYDRPDRPSFDRPGSPSYDKPDKPSYNRPHIPFYERPDRPMYDIPYLPVDKYDPFSDHYAPNDKYKPHRPDQGNGYDNVRPSKRPHYPSSEIDHKRPYPGGSSQIGPYGLDSSSPSIYGSAYPYGTSSQSNPPYKNPTPLTRPDSNYGDKNQIPFSERPFDPYWNTIKPHPVNPDNPNYYDDSRPATGSSYGSNWDRISEGSKPSYSSSSGSSQNSTYLEGSTQSGYAGENVKNNQSKPGEISSSSVNEIHNPCFRRVLPGKRLRSHFIKKAVPCERAEDCHRECSLEKRFVCEGFNYRLDPTGRGQGDCELSDMPLSRVDIGRDIFPDREYDYYEKDRNSGPDCRPLRYGPGQYPPSAGGHRYGSGYPPPGSWQPGPVGPYPGGHYPPSGGGGRYPPSGGGGGRYPPSGGGGHYPPSGGGGRYPPSGGGGRYPPDRYPPEHGRYPAYPSGGRPPSYDDRKGPPYGHDLTYIDRHDHHEIYGHHYPYRPRPPYNYDRPYGQHTPTSVYQDTYYHDRERDRHYWGLNHFDRPSRWGTYGGTYGNFGAPDSYYGYGGWRNSNRFEVGERRNFIPYRIGHTGGSRNWGQYGGSYGTGHSYYRGGYAPDNLYNYWGFNQHYRPVDLQYDGNVYEYRSIGDRKLHFDHDYDHFSHLDDHHHGGIHSFDRGHINYIGYEGDTQNRLSRPRPDDCSSRSGTGFRLHKAVVKKYFSVPDIHECEQLCYKEKDFHCASFSYRYSITLSSPSDNCYLSDRSFKELDFYTDLEPDRDFDIYSMSKTESCLIPVLVEESECFLRVRSGQRLAHTVVKDSMDVKSIADCQLECLTSRGFTCRSFSYRFEPPLRGGTIDNCQLSDWPYAELDTLRDLIPEPGYEIYERGSYGHGCEEDHFTIPGYRSGIPDGSVVSKPSDKICYVGYAKPARLSPEASKGALSVANEVDCKAECTRAREETQFPCMSFSYRSVAAKGEPNCELSDIEQRDLLPDIDYIRDADSWLFAWDNYSPQCSLLSDPDYSSHSRYPLGPHNPLDTWKTYSVSGWPCRRGTTCRENREAGFWSCELEGGEVGSWDYCCRPDHQCGYSHGYGYPWCYVGPSRDQWRKCSDRYYPYIYQSSAPGHSKPSYGVSSFEPYLPRPGASPWHSSRPYRPPHQHSSPHHFPPPSLEDYEHKFDQQFLDPPTPGGFGPGRHWPVSYLHKEMPPNTTLPDPDRQNRKLNSSLSRYTAINNLVDSIKSKDFKSLNYQATNQSNSADDILLVRIPVSEESAKVTRSDNQKVMKFDVVDTKSDRDKNNAKKFDQFDDLFLITVPKNKTQTDGIPIRTPKRELRMFPLVRRGSVVRTNRTDRSLQIFTNRDRLRFFSSK